MASIQRRGSAWRAELYKDGRRESNSFPTKAQAVKWAMLREAELTGPRLPENTVRDALRRYGEEVAPKHRGAKWEKARLGLLERDPLADVRLPILRHTDLAEWRERRLAQVSTGSVRREMSLLQSVFKSCRKDWGWLDSDPIKDVDRPRAPASRKRRVSQEELDRLVLALGYNGGVPSKAGHRVALSFMFALETAMRAGEILSLTWAHVAAKSVTLPITKNGDLRRVPLTVRAREIIALLPKDADTVFNLDAGTRDVLFRRARDAAKIENLHFHDSRAEAIWRLSKKLDVLELARIIGHRDMRSLLIYYQIDADDLADRLG